MKAGSVLRDTTSALLTLLLPTPLARPLLVALGRRIAPGSRIGLSWVYGSSIGMDRGARIGHFNIIAVRRLLLRECAQIGRGNVIKGPVDVVLRPRAAIGNGNRVLRAALGVTSGTAQLWLGSLAKITARHHIDCTRTIRLGANSTLAGAGSQVWTHGYVHDLDGEGRYRIDGGVVIDHNVYLGAACIVTAGVQIAAGVIVGAGTTVARSLREPGTYVSPGLRRLDRPADPDSRADLQAVDDPRLCERVYVKRAGQ